MSSLLDTALVVVVILNVASLGTSRLRALIRLIAFQGVVLGAMPLLVHTDLDTRVVLIAAATIALKGGVIPWMLFRATRNSHIRREVEPFVSLATSMLLGGLGTGIALAFAQHLPLTAASEARLIVAASLATVLTGFIILTTRRKAITQVLGYLVLENGIFIFGLLLLEAVPLLVEAGVLLDLTVAVFVMGIMINHIHREFSTIDTSELSSLREE